MTIIDDRALPSRPGLTELSTDVPSAPALRPFGLTQAAPLNDDEGVVVLDGATYDPHQQLNIDPTGQPWVAGPGVPHMKTSTDTQYDTTWVTDYD
ncbi:putative ATP-grasp-modified RiPP [Actinosynnema pretiosum subsp. pretiosum]|uniref:ATP-grasp-modified RiPP n=1 Tax=Actinosynnema pretiosum subsp. pretiosum TaxID=103721 RepID=A0AA45R3L0_9PSEU|nr:hypothetical protein APASM_4719 [Actinosynnema pretiosum subsp. pretiosum]QUF03946.1 putative ATP-grasp-modified RiPP [Actinosynnema pretiosum subsp. pretiosum]